MRTEMTVRDYQHNPMVRGELSSKMKYVTTELNGQKYFHIESTEWFNNKLTMDRICLNKRMMESLVKFAKENGVI
jgi:hypothetical protein